MMIGYHLRVLTRECVSQTQNLFSRITNLTKPYPYVENFNTISFNNTRTGVYVGAKYYFACTENGDESGTR